MNQSCRQWAKATFVRRSVTCPWRQPAKGAHAIKSLLPPLRAYAWSERATGPGVASRGGRVSIPGGLLDASLQTSGGAGAEGR